MNPVQWLREKTRQLLQLKDSSHSIALGTAIGMFFGFIPLWGLKTLLALGVCRLLRGNLLATAIAATLHDVALPLLPLLLRIALIPLVAGISYEIIRFAAKHPGTLFALISKPGLWLQRITTKEPDNSQAEVAIHALDGAMALVRVMAASDRDLRRLIVELAALDADDRSAVLDMLDAGERLTAERLLEAA